MVLEWELSPPAPNLTKTLAEAMALHPAAERGASSRRHSTLHSLPPTRQSYRYPESTARELVASGVLDTMAHSLRQSYPVSNQVAAWAVVCLAAASSTMHFDTTLVEAFSNVLTTAAASLLSELQEGNECADPFLAAAVSHSAEALLTAINSDSRVKIPTQVVVSLGVALQAVLTCVDKGQEIVDMATAVLSLSRAVLNEAPIVPPFLCCPGPHGLAALCTNPALPPSARVDALRVMASTYLVSPLEYRDVVSEEMSRAASALLGSDTGYDTEIHETLRGVGLSGLSPTETRGEVPPVEAEEGSPLSSSTPWDETQALDFLIGSGSEEGELPGLLSVREVLMVGRAPLEEELAQWCGGDEAPVARVCEILGRNEAVEAVEAMLCFLLRRTPGDCSELSQGELGRLAGFIKASVPLPCDFESLLFALRTDLIDPFVRSALHIPQDGSSIPVPRLASLLNAYRCAVSFCHAIALSASAPPSPQIPRSVKYHQLQPPEPAEAAEPLPPPRPSRTLSPALQLTVEVGGCPLMAWMLRASRSTVDLRMPPEVSEALSNPSPLPPQQRPAAPPKRAKGTAFMASRPEPRCPESAPVTRVPSEDVRCVPHAVVAPRYRYVELLVLVGKARRWVDILCCLRPEAAGLRVLAASQGGKPSHPCLEMLLAPPVPQHRPPPRPVVKGKRGVKSEGAKSAPPVRGAKLAAKSFQLPKQHRAPSSRRGQRAPPHRLKREGLHTVSTSSMAKPRVPHGTSSPLLHKPSKSKAALPSAKSNSQPQLKAKAHPESSVPEHRPVQSMQSALSIQSAQSGLSDVQMAELLHQHASTLSHEQFKHLASLPYLSRNVSAHSFQEIQHETSISLPPSPYLTVQVDAPYASLPTIPDQSPSLDPSPRPHYHGAPAPAPTDPPPHPTLHTQHTPQPHPTFLPPLSTPPPAPAPPTLIPGLLAASQRLTKHAAIHHPAMLSPSLALQQCARHELTGNMQRLHTYHTKTRFAVDYYNLSVACQLRAQREDLEWRCGVPLGPGGTRSTPPPPVPRLPDLGTPTLPQPPQREATPTFLPKITTRHQRTARVGGRGEGGGGSPPAESPPHSNGVFRKHVVKEQYTMPKGKRDPVDATSRKYMKQQRVRSELELDAFIEMERRKLYLK